MSCDNYIERLSERVNQLEQAESNAAWALAGRLLALAAEAAK